MRRSSSCLLLACLVGAARPGPGRADAATETRLREALRSAQSQIRSLEDERGQWQSREADMKKEVEAAQKEAAAAQKRSLGERVAPLLQRRLAEQEKVAARLQESLGRCEAATAAAAATVRTAEADRARAKSDADALAARLAASEARNARMYRLGKEIIDWVSSIGARVESEPVLGFKRVELENIAQGYDDKLLEQRTRP